MERLTVPGVFKAWTFLSVVVVGVRPLSNLFVVTFSSFLTVQKRLKNAIAKCYQFTVGEW